MLELVDSCQFGDRNLKKNKHSFIMLHIAVILYEGKQMFSQINVNNKGWSGTRPTRGLKQSQLKPHLTESLPLIMSSSVGKFAFHYC